MYICSFFKNSAVLLPLFLSIKLFGMDTSINLHEPIMHDIITYTIKPLLPEKDERNLSATCKTLHSLSPSSMPTSLHKKLFEQNLAIECAFLASIHEKDHDAIEFILKTKRDKLNNNDFAGSERIQLDIKPSELPSGEGVDSETWQIVTAGDIINYDKMKNNINDHDKDRIIELFEKYKFPLSNTYHFSNKSDFNPFLSYDLIIATCLKQSKTIKLLLDLEKKNANNPHRFDSEYKWKNSISPVLLAAVKNLDFETLSILQKDEAYSIYIKNNNYNLLKNFILFENNSERTESLLLSGFFDVNSFNPDCNKTMLDHVISIKQLQYKRSKHYCNKQPICDLCIYSGKGYNDKVLRLLLNNGAKTKKQLDNMKTSNEHNKTVAENSNKDKCIIQ